MLFKITGVVKKHLGRGRELGFPTANIEIDRSVPDGIYVAWTILRGQRYPSLFFAGSAKTFGEAKRHGEIYILDFSEEIYGEKVEVEVLDKIRENKKFDSSAELIEQMRLDEKRAKEYFDKLKG